MHIKVITVGKIKKPYIAEGINEYFSKIRRYTNISFEFIKDEKLDGSKTPEMVLKTEAQRIKDSIKKDSFVIALWEGGKTFSSKDFSKFLQARMNAGEKELVFVIGGAYGLDKSFIESAKLVLSFSPMTFAHEMAALILFEQLYRGFAILKGEPYTKY